MGPYNDPWLLLRCFTLSIVAPIMSRNYRNMEQTARIWPIKLKLYVILKWRFVIKTCAVICELKCTPSSATDLLSDFACKTESVPCCPTYGLRLVLAFSPVLSLWAVEIIHPAEKGLTDSCTRHSIKCSLSKGVDMHSENRCHVLICFLESTVALPVVGLNSSNFIQRSEGCIPQI